MPNMCSSRVSASRGELAWMVVIEPSCPVFIACSMSSTSAPRTSPMMMRSGRMRRLLRNKSRWEISPLPSILGGRVSKRTTCGCCNCNSAASSMVMMRSSTGMLADMTLSKVVLPLPVPPETSTFNRARTRPLINSAMPAVSAPMRIKSCTVKGTTAKRRIDNKAPSMAKGAITALTREPSGNRASTMGLISSTRRPMRETMRSMTRSKWASLSNCTSVCTILPRRSA